MAYLDGALELMRPSKDHERIKSFIGCLVEVYAEESDIDLSPYGAWTLEEPPQESGLEPDECYIVGADQEKRIPDSAIEVVWTSGGLDKLEIYRRLGIREVWTWKSGAIAVQVRGDDRWERVPRSRALPGLDLALLASFLDHPTAIQAMRAFRAALSHRG